MVGLQSGDWRKVFSTSCDIDQEDVTVSVVIPANDKYVALIVDVPAARVVARPCVVPPPGLPPPPLETVATALLDVVQVTSLVMSRVVLSL